MDMAALEETEAPRRLLGKIGEEGTSVSMGVGGVMVKAGVLATERCINGGRAKTGQS